MDGFEGPGRRSDTVRYGRKDTLSVVRCHAIFFSRFGRNSLDSVTALCHPPTPVGAPGRAKPLGEAGCRLGRYFMRRRLARLRRRDGLVNVGADERPIGA